MTDKEPLALPSGVDRLSDLGTLLTLKETAQKLGKSEKTVRRMITRGDLAGAHQVEMSNGKGMQWVVPYSSVIAIENATRQQINPDPVTTELAELREKLFRIEQELEVQKVLATERAHALEQLHLTFRLSLPSGEQSRRKWWKKS
jgi:predicted transcriptional regulator